MSFDGTTYSMRQAIFKLEEIDRQLDDIAELLDDLRSNSVMDGFRERDIDDMLARMRDI